MVCVACTADVPDDDVFCENCGVKLLPEEAAAPGCVCGAAAGEVDEDGFCLACGRRVRRPLADHMEVELEPGFAAASDRGLRHERNEDRFAIAKVGSGSVLVVCDGVSATRDPDLASATVCEALVASLVKQLGAPEETAPSGDAEGAIVRAVAEAAETLRQQAGEGAGDAAPSTTAVVAVVQPNEITVGWVGDSRAYWVDDQGAHLLTRDHSWLNTVLATGEMSQAEAEAAPMAHAITRWIGADAEDAATPDVVHCKVENAGTLLLCSDGLWNYASAPDQMTALLEKTNGESALTAARALVQFALEQGGRDNITVALLQVHPAEHLAPEPRV